MQGLAASYPFDRRDPLAPENRRISIVVMTREAEERVFRGPSLAEPATAAEPPQPVQSMPPAGSSLAPATR